MKNNSNNSIKIHSKIVRFYSTPPLLEANLIRKAICEIDTILRISGYGLNPYFAAPTTAAAASAAPASEE